MTTEATAQLSQETRIQREIQEIQEISKGLPQPVFQGHDNSIREWHIPFIDVKCRVFRFGPDTLEKFKDITDSGIYFLFDSETFAGDYYKTPNLYIGQTKKPLGSRLQNHANNPQKFSKYDTAVTFSSKDITDTLLNIIEKECIEVAVGCRRVLSTNRTNGNSSSSESKDLYHRATYFCAVIAKLLEAVERPALTMRRAEPFTAIRAKRPQLIQLCYGKSKLLALELENKGLLVLKNSTFSNFKRKGTSKDPKIAEICASLDFNNYFDNKESKLLYDYFVSSKERASQIFLGMKLDSSRWKPAESDLSLNNWDRAIVEKFFSDKKEETPECLEGYPLAKRCYTDIYNELCNYSEMKVELPASQSLLKGLSFNLRVNGVKVPRDHFRFWVNSDGSVTIKLIKTKARISKGEFEVSRTLSDDGKYFILTISDLAQWEAIGGDICRYIFRSLSLSSTRLERQADEKSQVEKVQSKNTVTKDDCVHLQRLGKALPETRELYARICDYVENLGDDVSRSQKKFYLAYQRSQNFVCIEMQTRKIALYLQLDPRKERLEDGFSRDMTHIGHHGTGSFQILISDEKTLEKALPYIKKAYERNA